MELAPPGAADLARAEVSEGVQAEERGEWEARDPAQAPRENVCVRVVEILLPTRWDYPATS